MKSLAAASLQTGYILAILNGVDKGATYQIGFGRITLGRESDNTIVIKDDPKVSRHHAVINVGAAGCEISCVSDRNKVLVDGTPIVTRHALLPNSLIQMGNTKLRLSVPGRDLANPSAGDMASPYGMPSAGSRRRSSKKSSGPFYIILAVVGLMLYMLLSNSAQKTEPQKDILTTSIEATIEESKKNLAELENARKKSGLSERQYDEAQTHYIKGFRDYQKGQYDRARESFEACLAIYANHPQCGTYKVLAEQKFSELIESYLNLGRKYQSQNQFSACKASLRNVLILMKDRSSPIFKEAETNYKLCDALDKGQY